MDSRLGIRFVIVGRILNGKQTIGYDLFTYNSGRIPASKEQVQTLAQQGYITNAQAELQNGEFRLHGRQGTNLNKLPQRQIRVAESLI